MELLGHDQVQFFINGVKLSFYIADCRNPLKDTVPFMGNIILADIDSIPVMKMELALTRGKYRDYYDLYCAYSKTGKTLSRWQQKRAGTLATQLKVNSFFLL